MERGMKGKEGKGKDREGRKEVGAAYHSCDPECASTTSRLMAPLMLGLPGVEDQTVGWLSKPPLVMVAVCVQDVLTQAEFVVVTVTDAVMVLVMVAEFVCVTVVDAVVVKTLVTVAEVVRVTVVEPVLVKVIVAESVFVTVVVAELVWV
jgi:hypothetical protein